jgi:hypothetical protein
MTSAIPQQELVCRLKILSSLNKKYFPYFDRVVPWMDNDFNPEKVPFYKKYIPCLAMNTASVLL